jgi:GntR family transcriptional regulator, histidine utilization repressor
MVNMTASLHARIRGDIENRIVTGEWRPGFRIPPEHELMLQYDCSRMTVNKAVATLTAAGLVTRNKRAGTIVAKPPLHSAVLQIPDIRHEIETRGGVYSYVCLKVETRKKESVVFVRCLHFDDGAALMLEEREIFLNAIAEARGVDFNITPPGSWLIDHVAWTEAEHRISACAADVVTAKALDVDLGAACLVVERKTWRGSQTITQVRQLFRSDTYDVIARFSPSSSNTVVSPDC